MIFTFELADGNQLRLAAPHIIGSVGTDGSIELITTSGRTWHIDITPGSRNRGVYIEWLEYSKH